MKRAEILEAARVCVCGEREQDYGSPEDSFGLIAQLWTAYMGTLFTSKDVAMLMALLKVARIKAGDKADSFVDLDTMVLWTLFQCYGWREKRLHDFYLAMAKEHRRMREFYEMDDLYPERYKLKEKGIDIEKWQEEVLRDDP